MTHSQRNAAILDLIEEYTKRNTRSPEQARAALIAEGLYEANGDLRAELGGPGWERKAG
ncbi:hypothetical protein [Sphingomonas sp.]|uniref:hypothetical protein n=1 Tax=Sphingomonas sp. TaxID=28214 RepID=UPI002EDAAA62